MSLIKPKRKQDRNLLQSIRRMPCCICGTRDGVDCSHIKTRGSGGPDEPWNIFPKCRTHHIQWGQYGWSKFCQVYPHFKELLSADGWYEMNGKLWNDRLNANEQGLEPDPSPRRLHPKAAQHTS